MLDSGSENMGLDAQNPRTREALPRVNVASETGLKECVQSARRAHAEFRNLTFEARKAMLVQAAKALLERRREGLALVEAELGKAPADALFTEALGPLDAVKAWVTVIENSPSGKLGLNPIAFPKKDAKVVLVPRGVVAVIAPWNFPIAGLYRSVFPALLLGNAVVVKPSELSPRSSAWFLSVLAEHLPRDIVQVAQGTGAIGDALLRSGVDACVFTGSVATGRKVEERCRELGIQLSAELGGNDAAIVLHDAHLPRTVAGITQWALQNAGQACGAIELVLADARISETLAHRLADAFSRLKGNEANRGTASLAPLANEKQLNVVLSHLEDARKKGAKVLAGGQVEGLWVAPTVLYPCRPDMAVVREESFGPLLPIVPVDGAFEAISWVNQGAYGLTASLWTQDLERANRLAEDLDVGTVTINNHAFTGAIPALPWSGRRDSGTGIANSAWSLLTFARPKTIVTDRSQSVEPFWLPYDDALLELGHLLADAQLGKLGSAYKIPLALRQRAKSIKAFFGFGD